MTDQVTNTKTDVGVAQPSGQVTNTKTDVKVDQPSGHSQFWHKADEGLQDIGTLGVAECVISGGIMTVIGYAIMHWANNIRAGVYKVQIISFLPNHPDKIYGPPTCAKDPDDNHIIPGTCTQEITYYYTSLMVMYNNKPMDIGPLTTTTYFSKNEYIPVKINPDTKQGEYNPIAGPAGGFLHFFGLVLFCWGIVKAGACYFFRNNPWVRRILGVRTTAQLTSYALEPLHRH